MSTATPPQSLPQSDITSNKEEHTLADQVDQVVKALLNDGLPSAISYSQIEVVLQNLGYDPFEEGELYLRIIECLEKQNILIVEQLPDDHMADSALVAADEADEAVEILTRALISQDEYRHALLSADRERRLLEVYHDGLRARQELEGETSLLYRRSAERRIVAAEQALDELVRCNLRLVAKMAVHASRRARHLEVDDLLQEGRIGLFRAIEKYNLSLNLRLSTYATWWIRQSIERALADNDRLIRLPVHAEEALHRMNRVAQQWVANHGKEPTIDELAQEMRFSPEKIRTLRTMSRDCISLDLPVGEDGNSSFGDFLPDYSSFDPETVADKRSLRAILAQFLALLPERERVVLELRFGWHDDAELTLEAIGQRFGVTRERIRQIEVKALKKLQNWRFRQRLEDYRA